MAVRVVRRSAGAVLPRSRAAADQHAVVAGLDANDPDDLTVTSIEVAGVALLPAGAT